MAGKEVRVALIMGGGVSLGSFSGGALAEVVRLLEKFPATRPDAQGNPVPIAPKIDVVSGASAGSMTLAILVRYLLAGAKADEIATAMNACWVEGVGVDYDDPTKQLLPDPATQDVPALLSSKPIRALATTHLSYGYGDNPPRPPSVLLGDTVYASFAVANLNGIDIRAPFQWIRQSQSGEPDEPLDSFGDGLVTTFHDDRVRFSIGLTPLTTQDPPGFDPDIQGRRIEDRNTPAGSEPWRVFQEAAIASGAFPAAFAPVPLERRAVEYGPFWPDELAKEPLDRFTFTYVDGGTFRNEPMKEAIELAAIRDEGDDPSTFERVFLLIDPFISGSDARRTLDFEDPLALTTTWGEDGVVERDTLARRDYASLLTSVLSRLVSVVVGQATFRDWLRVAKVNSHVEWERELEAVLKELRGDGDAGSHDARGDAPGEDL